MNISTKIKVAFLDYSHIYAGAERMLFNMIANLDQSKYEPVLVFPYPMEHQHGYNGLDCDQVYLAPSLSWWMGSDRWEHPLRGTDFLKRTILGHRLACLIKKRGIDILDVNLMRGDVMMWVWATRKFTKAKIVGHYRSQEQGFVPGANAQKLFDVIACVSRFSQQQFQKKGIFTKTQVLYDSVDIDLMVSDLTKEEAKNKLGFNKDIILLSSIGQLSERKGHDNAIRSFAKIADKYPSARLLIAGGGSLHDVDTYKQIAKDVYVANKVIIPGKQLSNIQDVYRATDLTLTLTKDGEGFGLVPYESTLMGTPFIGTNIGAINEFVTDMENGLLVDPLNIDAIANKIDYALSHTAETANMVNRLKGIIHEKLHPQVLADNLDEFYSSI
jgi:glycosyltransferase involved in cell wall biosynthesis